MFTSTFCERSEHFRGARAHLAQPQPFGGRASRAPGKVCWWCTSLGGSIPRGSLGALAQGAGLPLREPGAMGQCGHRGRRESQERAEPSEASSNF